MIFYKAFAIQEGTSGSSFCETSSDAVEWIPTVRPETRRQKLSSSKIFGVLSRSRTLFANRLRRQPTRATSRPGFPSARVCFTIAVSRLIQPFCRASGLRERCVAVIGPGVDFTDKGFGYDFY